MADSIGLIERAAALLRQREAAEFGSPPPIRPASFSDAAPAAAEPVALDGAELILDRGQLASFGITVPSAERSRTAEEFRLLKRNLMAAWPAGNKSNNEHPSRIVMITSSRPGEGKTFVSLNLAFAFASEREVKAAACRRRHSSLGAKQYPRPPRGKGARRRPRRNCGSKRHPCSHECRKPSRLAVWARRPACAGVVVQQPHERAAR